MFALCALLFAVSEAGERRQFMPQYGQAVQAQPAVAVAPPKVVPQVVYYGDMSGDATEEIYYVNAAASPRAPGPVMVVTERDAEGNPVTHTEMFDPIWAGICIAFMLVACVKLSG
jgi:hypothetical protein